MHFLHLNHLSTCDKKLQRHQPSINLKKFREFQVPMIFTFLLFHLFLVVHIYLQQSDEHSKQDAKKLQIGASLSHLATDK